MKLSFAIPIALAVAGLAAAGDDPVIFKSDVALARVDAQVLDRSNRPITNLSVQDFALTVNGKPQEIKNFSREDMPADLVLLFDVSASMRPHVERIAFAGRQSLNALGERDRVAIMVFDRHTRVRMGFQNDLNEVDRQLRVMLDQERFNGGTDITQALYYAAGYIRQNGRRDARRFVVILTDDATERDRDDAGVTRAFDDAGAVLSFLQAPDAMSYRNGGYGGSGYPGGGGQYPGGGGRRYPGGGYPGGGYPGTSLPDIIFGRRYPNGGGGYPGGGGGQYPGGGGGYGHTHSAGTAEIAQRTGGDTIPVDDAAALETTLSRLRQRYTLNFYMPGDENGRSPNIRLALANPASRRYPDAELRYRRVNIADGDATENAGIRGRDDNQVIVSRGDSGASGGYDRPPMSDEDPVNKGVPDRRRRRGVSDGDSVRPINTDSDSYSTDHTRPSSESNQGGWRRTSDPNSPSQPAAPDRQSQPSDNQSTDKQAKPSNAPDPAPKDPTDNSSRGGWRKVKPGDQD